MIIGWKRRGAGSLGEIIDREVEKMKREVEPIHAHETALRSEMPIGALLNQLTDAAMPAVIREHNERQAVMREDEQRRRRAEAHTNAVIAAGSPSHDPSGRAYDDETVQY